MSFPRTYPGQVRHGNSASFFLNTGPMTGAANPGRVASRQLGDPIMATQWYDPFRWNTLLSDWCVYRSRHAADRLKDDRRTPLHDLLKFPKRKEPLENKIKRKSAA
jgi:hypothetical protein